MWKLQPTTTWQKDQRWYEKKRGDELAAVLANLTRYHKQLEASQNSKCIMAGYLHPEQKGVIAVDQRGARSNLQETRLYTFADDGAKVLYLITIGSKDDQESDIQLCNEFVDSLRKA